jgi:hypothetical protein
MNIILISPNFPPNYYHFAVALRRNGANVLGIGDAAYQTLLPPLQDALTEYFRLDALHDYDWLLRACAYFTYHYGKIQRLESHNEYWLENDARLRTDFNIPGLKLPDVQRVKRKSRMKEVFEQAGMEMAQGAVVHSKEEAQLLIDEVGYPLIAKPDVGVGAAGTYKIEDEADLDAFFAQKPLVDYLLEDFITGQLYSFDGLADRHGRLVFYTAHVYEPGIMEVVNEDRDVYACSLREIPPGLKEAGTRAVRAFDVRERFFHIEFFRAADGRWLAVEMNIRPPGGLMMDVFNYANDIDLYQQWANLVVFDTFTTEYSWPYHCAFVGRKYHHRHRHTKTEIKEVWGPLLVHQQPVDRVFARAMGDYAYILRSPDLEEVQTAIDFILETA